MSDISGHRSIVLRAISEANIDRLTRLAYGEPCACLGPRDGDPVCPCEMRMIEVRKYIVPYGLRHGKVVLTPYGRTLAGGAHD